MNKRPRLVSAVEIKSLPTSLPDLLRSQGGSSLWQHQQRHPLPHCPGEAQSPCQGRGALQDEEGPCALTSAGTGLAWMTTVAWAGQEWQLGLWPGRRRQMAGCSHGATRQRKVGNELSVSSGKRHPEAWSSYTRTPDLLLPWYSEATMGAGDNCTHSPPSEGLILKTATGMCVPWGSRILTHGKNPDF